MQFQRLTQVFRTGVQDVILRQTPLIRPGPSPEIVLKDLGLTDCRVRYHDGDVARLELPPGDVARFATEPVRSRVTTALHGLGFKFVTLDLDGLRSGSLNDLVPLEVKSRFGGAR